MAWQHTMLKRNEKVECMCMPFYKCRYAIIDNQELRWMKSRKLQDALKP